MSEAFDEDRLRAELRPIIERFVGDLIVLYERMRAEVVAGRAAAVSVNKPSGTQPTRGQ